MALKDMEYCFRPLASDLASLVTLNFTRMVSRACMIDEQVLLQLCVHLVSDKR